MAYRFAKLITGGYKTWVGLPGRFFKAEVVLRKDSLMWKATCSTAGLRGICGIGANRTDAIAQFIDQYQFSKENGLTTDR